MNLEQYIPGKWRKELGEERRDESGQESAGHPEVQAQGIAPAVHLAVLAGLPPQRLRVENALTA